MVDAHKRLRETMGRHNLATLREAAFVHAVERVHAATGLRGQQ